MKIDRFLRRLSASSLIFISFSLVALLTVISYFSDPSISFLIFYTLPVFLSSWYVGRWAGLLLCGATAISLYVLAFSTQGFFSNWLIPFWNASARASFMVLLAFLVTAFKRSLEHEQELARTDFLTGAVNSRFFNTLAEIEIKRARRSGQPFSVAYMDIDNFKQVNDRSGHSAGDLLLKTVAETLKKHARDSDIIARLGGDEFALLLPDTDETAALVAIQRIRLALLDVVERCGWPVTFSLGVVTWEEPPSSIDDMVGRADDLMYETKRHGKNAIRHTTASHSAQAA